MESIVDTITTAVARSATARVASSLPMTVRQEAMGVATTANITLRPTAAVAALATDGAARVPRLANRGRSVTAVEVEAALVVTNRQALDRPYPTVRSHPTLLPHREALRPAGHTVRHREAIVHRQEALRPVGLTVRHPEAIVHHQEAILHPVVPTVRHQEAIVHHQDQVAIREEHKVAEEVLEAAGDLTVGMIDYDSPTQIRGKGKSCVPKGQKPPAQGSRPGI